MKDASRLQLRLVGPQGPDYGVGGHTGILDYSTGQVQLMPGEQVRGSAGDGGLRLETRSEDLLNFFYLNA